MALFAACAAGACSGGWSDAAAQSEDAAQRSDWLAVSVTDDGVEVVDLQAGGRTLLSPNGGALWRQARNAPTVLGRVQVEPAESGFDLLVELHNPGQASAEAGEIVVGGFRFGPQVRWRDFRHDGKALRFDAKDRPFFSAAYLYPQQQYSPVAVLHGESATVGVAALYDAVETRSSVRVQLRRPGGPYTRGGWNWEIGFTLLDELQPGQSMSRRLTVRFARPGEPWTKTLEPYRDFFRARFGGVRYRRDGRAVAGVPLAQRTALSRDNPFGYVHGDRRPDIHGWDPWARELEKLAAMGYARIMLWAPTGLFKNNVELNYPFLFASPMRQRPMMRVSLRRLRALAEGPVELGLWWGRSQQVMFGWDDRHWELLDPDDPEHRRRAFAELDAALEAGAEMIGLDAFAYMPIDKAARWLDELIARAPQTTFVVEPATADVLHLRAPMWVNGTQVRERNEWADYLLPGNEIWAGVRYDVLEKQAGRRLDARQRLREARRLADLGYTPVVFAPQTVPGAGSLRAVALSP